jgi:hypothetical protein
METQSSYRSYRAFLRCWVLSYREYQQTPEVVIVLFLGVGFFLFKKQPFGPLSFFNVVPSN